MTKTMPIYEYHCAECGARFEKLVRGPVDRELPLPPCPECGGQSTTRVLSRFARHGPPGTDDSAVQAERAAAQRLASVTPKEQIDKWRSQRKKKN